MVSRYYNAVISQRLSRKAKTLILLLGGASAILIAALSLRITHLPCFEMGQVSLLTADGCSGLSLTTSIELSRGANRDSTAVTMPVSLIDWRWTSTLGVEEQAVVELPIFNKGGGEITERFNSHTVIWVRQNEPEVGLRRKAADFATNPRYIKVGEVGSFYVYEQRPTKVSWMFYVPRVQPKHHFYLRCETNCTLYGKYHFVYYELHIPVGWIESSLEFQTLFHQFLDFTVIKP